MKRIWWFFHGHKLQADKPHDDLLQIMNVDFSTRSTYKGVVVLMPTNYNAADRHQRLVWISPGLVLNPSINRTRTESFAQRAESIISPFRCYYRDAQYLTAIRGQGIVSWI